MHGWILVGFWLDTTRIRPESNQNPTIIRPESDQNPTRIRPESNQNPTRIFASASVSGSGSGLSACVCFLSWLWLCVWSYLSCVVVVVSSEGIVMNSNEGTVARSTSVVSTESNNQVIDVVSRGYLTKRGRLIPSWNRRFFELTSTKLIYYTDESKAVEKGHFDLHDNISPP